MNLRKRAKRERQNQEHPTEYENGKGERHTGFFYISLHFCEGTIMKHAAAIITDGAYGSVNHSSARDTIIRYRNISCALDELRGAG